MSALIDIFHTGKTFGVKDVVEGMEYEFRVSAINNSGAGEFSTPSEFVFARDPKSRWIFGNNLKVQQFLDRMRQQCKKHK